MHFLFYKKPVISMRCTHSLCIMRTTLVPSVATCLYPSSSVMAITLSFAKKCLVWPGLVSNSLINSSPASCEGTLVANPVCPREDVPVLVGKSLIDFLVFLFDGQMRQDGGPDLPGESLMSSSANAQMERARESRVVVIAACVSEAASL